MFLIKPQRKQQHIPHAAGGAQNQQSIRLDRAREAETENSVACRWPAPNS